MERLRTLRTTSSASLENYKAAQEEGCGRDPGCRNVISKGSSRVIALEGREVCAATHIPNDSVLCAGVHVSLSRRGFTSRCRIDGLGHLFDIGIVVQRQVGCEPTFV